MNVSIIPVCCWDLCFIIYLLFTLMTIRLIINILMFYYCAFQKYSHIVIICYGNLKQSNNFKPVKIFNLLPHDHAMPSHRIFLPPLVWCFSCVSWDSENNLQKNRISILFWSQCLGYCRLQYSSNICQSR